MRGLRPVLPIHWSVGFLLLCFFHSSSSASSPPPAVHGSQNRVCNSRDRGVLVDFSRSLVSGVPGWLSNASGNCCRWPGVLCGVSSSSRNSTGVAESRVVGLELGKRNLAGAVRWIPLLGLDGLRTLNLSRNSLSGVITGELFQLRLLEVLDLSDNSFSGMLSNEIGNLSSLRHLDISLNRFSGTIPDAFDGLTKLQFFSAASNYLTGGLPASLSSCSMLASLDLGYNALSGRIGGFDWARLVRLRTLHLPFNKFVGQIPRSLSSCRELETLNLANNHLRGRVPRSFKNLQALSSLSLADNALSDASRAFSVLSRCRNLTALILSANFAGEMMPTGGIVGFERLKILAAADCGLFGSLPPWVGGCPELRVLDLSSNRLEGDVPPALGNLARLFFLGLSGNRLVGALPETFARLRSLASVDYSRSDDSPIGVPFLARRNARPGAVGYSLFSRIPSVLDLSRNELSGPILSGFGDLKGLIALNLSYNGFSGPIPEEMAGMTRLESMDLSHNNLSGSIPPLLDNLTFLSVFSVAYNNGLRGQVPYGRQFATFSNWSYEGNPGLCGPPLVISCVPTPPVNGTGTEEFRITFMPLPYGIGVVIGFIPTVACGLYCGFRRRKKKERRD